VLCFALLCFAVVTTWKEAQLSTGNRRGCLIVYYSCHSFHASATDVERPPKPTPLCSPFSGALAAGGRRHRLPCMFPTQPDDVCVGYQWRRRASVASGGLLRTMQVQVGRPPGPTRPSGAHATSRTRAPTPSCQCFPGTLRLGATTPASGTEHLPGSCLVHHCIRTPTSKRC
jgi:hypothetical protein